MHERSRTYRALVPCVAGGLSAVVGASLLAARPAPSSEEPLRAGDRELAYLVREPAPDEGTDRSFDRRLDELDERLQGARFHEVLRLGRALRAELKRSSREGTPKKPRLRDRLVELEIYMATAHLAMRAEAETEAALRRVLELDPGIALDPRLYPRKLINVLERLRPTHAAGHVLEASELDGPGDAPPTLARGARPQTPDGSSSLRPTIVCRLLVDTSGAVADARVYLPRPELRPFEEAALRAVRRFEFVPARSRGEPVAAWVQWPVSFR